jgi:hypothetical protein
VWNRGIQTRVTIVIGKSSRHLPCIVAEEVLKGTHGCGITGSGTAQDILDVSRAPDQDLGSKGSCHKVQYNQVLQDLMEQPYC